MTGPFVSVIIPNYNHAQYLDERIQSILNQTYQNFELIILDDKSTDNSLNVINQYKENPHVSHIVVNDENSGSSFKQWYKGFELAKGEIVWITESDDSCDSHLLEVLVRGYVANNSVLAFCRSCQYDINGNKSLYKHQTDLPSTFAMPGNDFISKYMICHNMVANASSAIFNRNIAMSLDRRYMSMRGEGDWLFWIYLLEHGNVFFSHEEFNYFRFHESNTTKSLTYRGISPVEHKIVFDYLVDNGFLSGLHIKNEILRLVTTYLSFEYGSALIKKKVMETWDKNRYFRFLLLYGKMKDILHFLVTDFF